MERDLKIILNSAFISLIQILISRLGFSLLLLYLYSYEDIT